MPDSLKRLRGFLVELKRRRVYRVAVAYVLVAAATLELVDIVVPSTRLPDWTNEFFIGLTVLGFPLAVFLAWAYNVTPHGVERTAPLTDGEEQEPESGEQPEDFSARTLAVLPFENLSGTDEAEPFAAGLHDDLLTELSSISALTVISRTSVMGYRGSNKPIPQVARELGVGTIVEGSVQLAGGRVRLNVQLIEAKPDVHRWAERYDRELTTKNIFDLQTELVGRIAGSLHAQLTVDEQRRPTRPPTDELEAYRLHARGREHFRRRGTDDLHQAAAYFQAAIDVDEHYAPAWSGLANSLIELGDYGHADPREVLPRGEKAARRALEIDPDLVEAHSALGNLHSARRDGPRAIARHERAVQLRPSYAQAHQWLNWVHLLLGDPHAALSAGEKATRLDPRDPEARGNLALARVATGQVEEGLTEALRALEIDSRFEYARWVKGLALHHLRRHREAEEAFGSFSESWARAWPVTSRAFAHALAGETERTMALATEQTEASRPFHAGLAYAAGGEADRAFEALQAADSLHWDETLFIRYPPPDLLDTILEDPRYGRFLESVDRNWGA